MPRLPQLAPLSVMEQQLYSTKILHFNVVEGFCGIPGLRGQIDLRGGVTLAVIKKPHLA